MEITYRNLFDFLTKHRAKDLNKPSTHTRIPSEEHNIYGGSYHIDKNELSTYYDLYYDHVFNKNNMEHLTETQLPDSGPILIDLDFKYGPEVKTRQHDVTHIIDIVQEYLLQIKEFLKLENGSEIVIYIMQKQNVNIKENMTKDGIHIIIGIHMDKLMKIILREKMLIKLPLVLGSFDFINTYEDIIDIGIAKGVTNWPMYGSRKPGNEVYMVDYKMKAIYSEEEDDFEIDNDDYIQKNDFKKLSAQYDKYPKFEINPKFVEEYNRRLEMETNPKKKSPNKNVGKKISSVVNLSYNNSSCLNEITNQEELDLAINTLIESLNPNEYILKELHEYVQILPEKYYRPGGSHLLNRQVAFGLKNKDDRLFLSWVKLRSKASDFNYSDIPHLYDEWCNFDKKDNGITHRSIIYWAKQDAFEEYENVKKNTIDYYIDNTMFEAGDWDYATVLYYMYKDKFICTNLKQQSTWYVFKKHRWEKDDGMSLRKNISTKLFQLYSDKQSQLLQDAQKYEPTDEKHGNIQRKIKQLANICIKFKDSGHKNKIMREASELFFDGEFNKLMDSNPYLLCFENGVYDFKLNEFRQGYPNDYVTKSTGRNYIKYDEDNPTYSAIYAEIHTFMRQIFPEEDLCKYMWDHLAAALIGIKREQAFNIYKGSGSNGKSILTELMSLGLGDYKGTVPVNLITDKRSAIGGTTSEIMALKGVRYAVMQELSANAVMNEGIMKEITSATEPLQGRALWCESETFIPQFSLVVCTNILPKIKSYDDGTWRRMKVTDFMSKFISDGEIHYHDNEYVFPKDKTLKEKLKNWAPAFVGMLVDIASKTMGEVIDCPQVVASSNKYRESQDCLSKFINTNIIKENGSGVKKTEINALFKAWFNDNYGNERMPRLTELDELMARKFGPMNNKTNKWMNIKIITFKEDDN